MFSTQETIPEQEPPHIWVQIHSQEPLRVTMWVTILVTSPEHLRVTILETLQVTIQAITVIIILVITQEPSSVTMLVTQSGLVAQTLRLIRSM